MTIPGLVRLAHAGCALPSRVEFIPATGSFLPRGGIVLVYVRGKHPSYEPGEPEAPRVTSPTGAVDADVRKLADDSGASVYRVQLPKSHKGPFTIDVPAGERMHSATFRTKHRSRPSDRATTVRAARYIYSSGDPGTDAFVLEIVPRALAYEVRDGAGKTFVVPNSQDHLTKSSRKTGAIIVGYMGCLDLRVPSRPPFSLSIKPLYASGEEGNVHSPSGGCSFSGKTGSCSFSSSYSFEFRGAVRSR